MDEITFAEQFVQQGAPTLGGVLARLATPDRAELDEARHEQAAAAEREARRENLALADRQMGSPLQHMSRAQAAVAEARAKVTDLEDQLQRARGVLQRAAETYVGYQEQAEVVQAAVSRSASGPDMLSEAKRVLTDAQIGQMAAARSRTPGRRPKGRGGLAVRSHAVRSESCIHCINQGVSDEDSYLLHSDPELNVPVTPPQQAAAAERQANSAHAPMIYR